MVLPGDFTSQMTSLLQDEYGLFEEALDRESPVSIRVNPLKTGQPLPYAPVPWSSSGYYLPERLTFTFDPLFHAGVYYVQEASSMFLGRIIETYIKEPVKCLDLCAAPGGKSTLLTSVLPSGSLLVSNEIIRSRCHVLAENIAKWGGNYNMVTNNDPESIGRLTDFFDVIVADVPCSGEGMFRKDHASISEWSLANVKLCSQRQRKILDDSWNALRPGGLLIYSTCTYNTEENEENIHYLHEAYGAEILSVPTNQEWGISGPLKYNHPVYRFLPHKTTGEGFFIAVVRKPDAGETKAISFREKSSGNRKNQTIPIPDEWKVLTDRPDEYHFTVINQKLAALPILYKDEMLYLNKHLNVIYSGIEMGEIKGKVLVPSAGLALNTALNRNAFEEAALSLDEAIQFLKKENYHPSASLRKGHALVTYQDHPLGFIKYLGNRSNNLYPSEWRIRSGYLPETLLTLSFR